MNWWYDLDYYCSHLEKESFCIMAILPTVTTTRKIRRAVNRLLPIGHRCRGDVGIA